MTTEQPPANPGPKIALRCQNCTTTAALTANEARGLSWRIWDGTTLGGTYREVRICPVCAIGDGIARGYDAECSTCMASMSDEWSDDMPEGGWTEEDAENWQQKHQCEPDVQIVHPKAVAAFAAA